MNSSCFVFWKSGNTFNVVKREHSVSHHPIVGDASNREEEEAAKNCCRQAHDVKHHVRHRSEGQLRHGGSAQGSGMCKARFAGIDVLRTSSISTVSRPKRPSTGGMEQKVSASNEAQKRRGLCNAGRTRPTATERVVAM